MTAAVAYACRIAAIHEELGIPPDYSLRRRLDVYTEAVELVSIGPDDTGRDPVIGELVALDAQSVTIRREAPEVGRVHVHFPRAGFILVPHRA